MSSSNPPEHAASLAKVMFATILTHRHKFYVFTFQISLYKTLNFTVCTKLIIIHNYNKSFNLQKNISKFEKKLTKEYINAIIKSKLLYGLECIQLTEAELKSINAFHMKGLRRIIKAPPTHIDRT